MAHPQLSLGTQPDYVTDQARASHRAQRALEVRDAQVQQQPGSVAVANTTGHVVAHRQVQQTGWGSHAA